MNISLSLTRPHSLVSLLVSLILLPLLTACGGEEEVQPTVEIDDSAPMNLYQGKPASQHTVNKLEAKTYSVAGR